MFLFSLENTLKSFSKKNFKQALITDAEFRLKLEQLERQVEQNTHDTAIVFEALRELVQTTETPRQQVGYRINQ